jgi:hypothetical protein
MGQIEEEDLPPNKSKKFKKYKKQGKRGGGPVSSPPLAYSRLSGAV